jgi:hypothetical protein
MCGLRDAYPTRPLLELLAIFQVRMVLTPKLRGEIDQKRNCAEYGNLVNP